MIKLLRITTLGFILTSILSFDLAGQHSVARKWNELLLESIRNDFARPTVHARNLFHISAVMYDAWAAYDPIAETYLLGKNLHGYSCDFNGIVAGENLVEDQKKALSYAAYRLLSHRFNFSPGHFESQDSFDSLMAVFGYDIDFTSKDYSTNNPAALGNYIAAEMIAYGRQDGSNEDNSYENQFYEPVNPPLAPIESGNSTLVDPNRWQPLSLESFIDQSGNEIPGSTPPFLGPEWGNVLPFSLTLSEQTKNFRDGHEYDVYDDPGAPPYLDLENQTEMSEAYKWGFSLVSIWGSHLDASDGTMIDISPGSIGNIQELPATVSEYDNFYNLLQGGDGSLGHDLNVFTNAPYEEQLVPRGDYARVLAEFWADGPDSETPPGHWFTIINYVNDLLDQKKYQGQGAALSNLEWDVKSYFILGGAMHDVAVTAWGIKGWYDYIRPISAIRYMAELGQSTDNSLPHYHQAGIPLVDGYIELVQEGDALAGANNENVHKIKLYTWAGHDYIEDPDIDIAGVRWILAENWWPYQRPSFVTPPFAGYISGHSTFSRAAAEVLTALTGDKYFPGGMGEFLAEKNKFLVFEEGPSMDVTLQWATYRDASDQCSLSRIWGGIHPPADDIPGRKIGEKIGLGSFEFATRYFEGKVLAAPQISTSTKIYPNPTSSSQYLVVSGIQKAESFHIYDLNGQEMKVETIEYIPGSSSFKIDISHYKKGMYLLRSKSFADHFIIN